MSGGRWPRSGAWPAWTRLSGDLEARRWEYVAPAGSQILAPGPVQQGDIRTGPSRAEGEGLPLVGERLELDRTIRVVGLDVVQAGGANGSAR